MGRQYGQRSRLFSKYTVRLYTNVAKRLHNNQFLSLGRRERLELRWQYARSFAEKITCSNTLPLQPVYRNILALAVFVLPRSAENLDGQVLPSF